MTIKNDKWIRDSGIITPCAEFTNTKITKPAYEELLYNPSAVDVKTKCISYGLSSYGYDVRCFDEFKIFTNVNTTVVDPKNFDDKNFKVYKGDVCIIPPNSFVLTSTVEHFALPRNILGICIGKSTYARCGIIANITPLEASWSGHITIELSNTTPLPVKIYANEGIAQVIFLEANEECEVSYEDRKGKYMGQTGITLPKV